LAGPTARANRCYQAGDPRPYGYDFVRLTVQPGGAVSDVNLPKRWIGTATGNCIQRAFATVKLPAFSGPSKTVTQMLDVDWPGKE
jgi:hypothetical protein